MAYKGGVPVNSGFYPRNDFPIVEAKDVYVLDELRLSELIQTYILNIDYENVLSFDVTEIVSIDNTTSILGKAVLGLMKLG